MTETRFGSIVMEDTGGAGRAIVMLHGLGGTSNTFEPIMPALEGYRVVRPDLPGAGRSAHRPNVRSLQDLARAITDAVTAAKVRRAVIVAHSMGTLLAQYMAVTAPHRVEGLVLLGALTEPPEAARFALTARAEQAERDGMVAIADQIANGSLSERSKRDIPAARAFVRESLMRQDPRGYAAHCRALAKATAFVPMRIRCPVRLITGSDDPVAPRTMAETLNTGLPFSKLDILPGVGHWPTIEAPEACSDLLRRALDDMTQNDLTERV
jgi:pimeloyl-ACP methyl ester carboxylesterase